MYYVYDLDVDEHGKRKRLYADTEEDLKKKIEEAKNNKQEELNGQIPIGSRLQDYVKFYFKNIIGKIATVKINHLIKLFSNAVFNTEIDHNMDENTEEDILRFYNQLLDKYLYENVLEIDDVLRNTYALANKTGAVQFDYSVIPVPQGKYDWGGAEYIMNGEEMQVLLKYCLEDNCQKYGSNELVTVFAIYTGLYFSKIVKINENDVDLDNATVVTEGRKISLSPECVEWLRKMQEEGSLHFDSDKPLFMNRKGEVASSSASMMSTPYAESMTCLSIFSAISESFEIREEGLHRSCRSVIHRKSSRISSVLPGYNRIPRPTICWYRLRTFVGRRMTMQSTAGQSQPSVSSMLLHRTE